MRANSRVELRCRCRGSGLGWTTLHPVGERVIARGTWVAIGWQGMRRLRCRWGCNCVGWMSDRQEARGRRCLARDGLVTWCRLLGISPRLRREREGRCKLAKRN